MDLETTDLSPYSDRIVEIAILRLDVNGEPIDQWSTRLNPEGPVGATFIHGIRDEDVVNAPTFRQVASTIAGDLSGLPIIAHNARFDVSFLAQEFWFAGRDIPPIPYYCTLSGSEWVFPALDRRRLVDCCWAAHVPLEDAHSAIGDATAVAGLFRTFHLQAGYPTPQDLAWAPSDHAQQLTWPSAPAREPQSRPSIAISPEQARIPRRISVSFARVRSQPALLAQLAGLTLAEMIDEGAPEGTTHYLETLLSALEDGQITAEEASALESLRHTYGLEGDVLERSHEAFMLALAHRAVDDGQVTAGEKTELRRLAHALAVPESTVKNVIDQATAARAARLSANLLPLPSDWTLGEPLHVGDKIAFTGEMPDREALEDRARSLGVRVMGNVSRLTAMLVTDDSFWGTKRDDAEQLGTRRVTPAELTTLLQHLQPARATHSTASRPATTTISAHTSTVTPSADVTTTASPAEVRAWATSVFMEVGVRGRLSTELFAAYARAHAD